MKRLLLILTTLTGLASVTDAQTNDNAGKIYVLNEKFYMDGIPLNDGELYYFLGEDVYKEEYLPAQKKIRTANTLGYIGGTCMGAGIGLAAGQLISSAVYGFEITAKPYVIYGSITLAGLIPTLVAFSLSKNGNATYARIADSYNKRTGKVLELTLGPASSGFGISLNF
ncbi:MAG: hypothetical protein E7115_07530 [Bacteroidales bacterium]|nr:hypothetical protein [Bacteroidales bacterium]